MTADEQRLRGDYYVEAERIRDHMHSTLSNDLGPGFHPPWREPPLREWYGLQWSYEGDFEFREATLRRYVPEPVIAQILAETPPSISRPDVADGKRVPGIAFAAGAALLLFIIVSVVRRLAARSRAESVATGESTTVELPEGYAELTAAQRDELAVAGRIVLDSLEPYILAAKPGDAPSLSTS